MHTRAHTPPDSISTDYTWTVPLNTVITLENGSEYVKARAGGWAGVVAESSGEDKKLSLFFPGNVINFQQTF